MDLKVNNDNYNNINSLTYVQGLDTEIYFLRLIEYICGCICLVILICRDGLVGYDAAFTQLRSWVQFPLFVFFLSFLLIIQSLSHYDIILLHIQYINKYIYNDPRA